VKGYFAADSVGSYADSDLLGRDASRNSDTTSKRSRDTCRALTVGRDSDLGCISLSTRITDRFAMDGTGGDSFLGSASIHGSESNPRLRPPLGHDTAATFSGQRSDQRPSFRKCMGYAVTADRSPLCPDRIHGRVPMDCGSGGAFNPLNWRSFSELSAVLNQRTSPPRASLAAWRLDRLPFCWRRPAACLRQAAVTRTATDDPSALGANSRSVRSVTQPTGYTATTALRVIVHPTESIGQETDLLRRLLMSEGQSNSQC